MAVLLSTVIFFASATTTLPDDATPTLPIGMTAPTPDSERGGLARGPDRGGQATVETPVEMGQRMAEKKGWIEDQWMCLYLLWNRESGWTVEKWNRAGSGAYGIGQALPASKMARYGRDYMTSARTQIRWGLAYIRARYGSPCGAWGNSQAHGYY